MRQNNRYWPPPVSRQTQSAWGKIAPPDVPGSPLAEEPAAVKPVAVVSVDKADTDAVEAKPGRAAVELRATGGAWIGSFISSP